MKSGAWGSRSRWRSLSIAKKLPTTHPLQPLDAQRHRQEAELAQVHPILMR
jgi:hypothetical protein